MNTFGSETLSSLRGKGGDCEEDTYTGRQKIVEADCRWKQGEKQGEVDSSSAARRGCPRRNRRLGTAMNHFRPTKEQRTQHRQNKNARRSRDQALKRKGGGGGGGREDTRGKGREERRGEKLANFSHPVWTGLAFQGASLDSRFSSLVLGPPRDETRTLLLLRPRPRLSALLLSFLGRVERRRTTGEAFSLSRCRGPVAIY